MSARMEAISRVKKRKGPISRGEPSHSLFFGAHTFSWRLMEETLPKKIFQNLRGVFEGKETLDLSSLDLIAESLKTWAIRHGATHYCHWFQPLTNGPAEKHDSFLSFNRDMKPIEAFWGKDLLRGEPDASSFPSGSLRSTEAARGYTFWDPSSPPFLWEGGDGVTLCIPALYFSWEGDALDTKTPLLRSDRELQSAVMRLLRLFKVEASHAFSTLGPEQEYFVIDRNLFHLRPDLMLAKRAVFGARSPKGQELEDHYFAPPKERVLSFMRDFEERAALLGIPIKTRHNEVAPSQFEVAPIFEKAHLAADHNVLLMEVMRTSAEKHDLVVLFHEKPFAHVNGSGKHCNWSIATDTGLNLLDPKENSPLFLTVLTATLRAVSEHAGLLRSSIGSLGNDYRLGGSEAPPAILSVYLGHSLETLVQGILQGKKVDLQGAKEIDLKLQHLPPPEVEASDRNRTSFFAFTGNKFEFRAVGASASVAFPITTINAIVKDMLNLILDEITPIVEEGQAASEILEKILPTLRRHLKIASPVLFSGNNYSKEWKEEAKKRLLPNIEKSFHAFAELLEKKSFRAFESILSERELRARHEVFIERYAKEMEIEIRLMIELFRCEILPAALRDQAARATSLLRLKEVGVEAPLQREMILQFTEKLNQSILKVNEMEKMWHQTSHFGWEAKGKVFAELLSFKMQEVRESVDALEAVSDDHLWPLPKMRELLFLI